jgi:twitching motility two-component system response regulator PilG
MTASLTAIDAPDSASDSDEAIRVLLIDDSPTIRSAAESYLAECGFTVLSCENGFEALSHIQAFAPDIVFTDIQMPRIDGYETVSLIRYHEELHRDSTGIGRTALPIIVLSSRGGVFDVAKGRLLGCTDYVVKPFRKETLLTAIQKHVHESRRLLRTVNQHGASA